MTALSVSLFIALVVLVVILIGTNRTALSLQKRIEALESHSPYYYQTMDGLNKRIEYLQKKLDAKEHELRVISGDRAALLAKNQVLEEQNQMLSDALRVMRN